MGRMGGVTEGDGSELTPVTGWQSLWRGQYLTTTHGHEYALDVDFFDVGEKLHLYRDGRQVAVGRTQAVFFSLTVLLVALGLELPQLLQAFTRADWWQELTGWTFRSPIELPEQVNTGLSLAGVLAGLERALRMQHNALLDE
ncbi:hypothetical protein I6I18_12560 [Kytococcus sedentarius]|uniref:Uncharacterized protein n=1 Tax=Kytococcus sedentarius (strain ATCC 14392 / DSM 20547 / JCM 11482 / CCUG 33030 / NBRC 15357 / NCTC 11040 / CCM 314 / 541) TaxID=478801 RepID=C7NJM5_KYTSD|nr:hypothetical protein [Kytococcus sedentarius]ACV05355.1 hypothetical protein Ksed_02750 [Kytococcus sedentarius DSM 20547]QQB63805.1 hypothetical protein I6I18_12560 [Kytococcus sedentarius]STX13230.1 Uncharacterised protein [Kytococcus sedentarius]